MTRNTRKEPINEEHAEAIIISGWRVTQPEAIKTTRHFEAKTPTEPEAEPDDTKDDDASQTNVGKGDE